MLCRSTISHNSAVAEERQPPEQHEPDELSVEELEAQSGDLLPDREAMSTLNPNVVVPSDPTAVADALLGAPHGDDAPQADEPPHEPEDPEPQGH